MRLLGTKGLFLSLIKAINENHAANIVINGETLKAFTLRSWKMTSVSTFTTSIQHCTVIFARKIRQEKETKASRLEKKYSFLYSLSHDLVYRKF